MSRFKFQQKLRQLEKRKGGYYYLKIDASIVEQFDRKRATRLRCILDGKLEYGCGLNHFGDGHFFIIVATALVKKINKQLGEDINFEIFADPNPLGVEVPEVLAVLLAQEADAKAIYDQLTDGKKRALIYSIIKVKNIDLQVEKILHFLAKAKK